jgi:hypothetical protein
MDGWWGQNSGGIQWSPWFEEHIQDSVWFQWLLGILQPGSLGAFATCFRCTVNIEVLISRGSDLNNLVTVQAFQLARTCKLERDSTFIPIGTLIAAVVPGELEYISKCKAVSYSRLG